MMQKYYEILVKPTNLCPNRKNKFKRENFVHFVEQSVDWAVKIILMNHQGRNFLMHTGNYLIFKDRESL